MMYFHDPLFCVGDASGKSSSSLLGIAISVPLCLLVIMLVGFGLYFQRCVYFRAVIVRFTDTSVQNKTVFHAVFIIPTC